MTGKNFATISAGKHGAVNFHFVIYDEWRKLGKYLHTALTDRTKPHCSNVSTDQSHEMIIVELTYTVQNIP